MADANRECEEAMKVARVRKRRRCQCPERSHVDLQLYLGLIKCRFLSEVKVDWTHAAG